MFKIILSLSLFISLPTFAKDFGLPLGEKAPQINMKDVDGVKFNLKKSLKKGPVVLVFYRGGWCPYCNLQLRNLQSEVVPSLGKYQATLVAISVDRLDEALKTKKSEALGITVLSDPTASLVKKYNVVNKVPMKLVKKYKSKYKIDLEKSSGKKHHIIAVPAVFIVKENGKISFSYANEDYKTRAQTKDILNALTQK
jgi:peroxiredoxin